MKALPYEAIRNRYSRLNHCLTEQSRRLWAASEAMELGYGGISAVARATGLMPVTISKRDSRTLPSCRDPLSAGQATKPRRRAQTPDLKRPIPCRGA